MAPDSSSTRVVLILTNQHVLGPTDYIAVQFDNFKKVLAVKLIADPQKDIAVIWADLSSVSECHCGALSNRLIERTRCY